MDAETGRLLAGRAHLEQSVRTVCLTRLASRVMLRDFGCGAPDAVDHRARASVAASVAGALGRYEPRLAVTAVRVRGGELSIEGLDLEGDEPGAPLTVRVSDFNEDFNRDFGGGA